MAMGSSSRTPPFLTAARLHDGGKIITELHRACALSIGDRVMPLYGLDLDGTNHRLFIAGFHHGNSEKSAFPRYAHYAFWETDHDLPPGPYCCTAEVSTRRTNSSLTGGESIEVAHAEKCRRPIHGGRQGPRSTPPT